MIHFKHFFSSQTKLLRLEQFHETLAIYQLDWDDTFAVSFFLGVRTEPTSGEQDSLVRAAHDSVPKITDLCSTNGLPNLLALKENLHCDERIEPE